jgi:quinol monooxygenase YgiN
MLIVAGYFDVDPDQRNDFIRGREEAMRRSRAEQGCLTYVFSADPLDPGRVHLFERWESKDALAAHIGGMRDAPRPANDVKVIAREVQQYEIANVGPVGS